MQSEHKDSVIALCVDLLNYSASAAHLEISRGVDSVLSVLHCSTVTFLTKRIFLQMPIYEQLVLSLVLKSCLSFTRWCFSHQAKRRLDTAGCYCSYKAHRHNVSEISQAQYSNMNIQLAVTSPFLSRLSPLSPPFFVFLSLPHTLSHSRRSEPLLLKA